ncbi:MAG: NAD(P)H-dependent oxidoreductase [Xanthobacteraceae bacterium]
MKHAVIFAHPNSESFVGSIASAYREEGLAQGQEIVFRDLYRMKFDPCLHESEIPWSKHFALRDDVLAERDLLRDADVFAFFYPIWLNAQPAILKGYLDRVFGMGFAFRREPAGNAPLMMGKRMISFTSSGAPTEWVIQTGAWKAMRTLFDGHFAAVCGLQLVEHIHFGGVVPGIRADSVEADMETTRKTFVKHFVE